MRASERPIRVAVVEDHTLFRSMLDHIVTTTDGLELAASCATVTQARTLITPGSADVALLDVDLPDGNGIALGVLLCRTDPNIKVVLLSAQDAIGLMLDLPKDVAGTWSYLSKTSTNDSGALVRAIKVAADGGSTLDPALLRRMRPRVGTKVAELTNRQYSVLRLLASGLSNAGIARELVITEKSVQNHVYAVYATLGIDASPECNPRVMAALKLIEETGSD
ncbi:DNA-binding response regulator, NarL/FixJ family, contains REC and HTH domains [Sanguibacter gelidistatuariae]|uniref:DNA-binding response regulator, NarL/FixJ family, contains REC and HTH domains n=1 Tax=Sanguibacter gelidistatuariae TaxID=1814289 RepID=A0A1G6TLP5_9MICO|nr:response regulator transcription factor [Sanguibacter gelidistatuariae]SDD30008.1 DNA-binding response regulator, NarL/FixJ family, contains REC and HTH domains [Sanguibacter gelidistatuariae]